MRRSSAAVAHLLRSAVVGSQLRKPPLRGRGSARGVEITETSRDPGDVDGRADGRLRAGEGEGGAAGGRRDAW